MTAPRRLLRRCAAGLAVIRLAGVYLALAVLKRAIPLPVLARWAWREPRGRRNREAERHAIARSIWLRRRLADMDRDCLQRSLLLYRELSRAGADPTLMVGFSNEAGRVQGHAWVVADGAPIGEAAPDPSRCVPTLSFGRRGLCARA
jgi:hypothetical protein